MYQDGLAGSSSRTPFPKIEYKAKVCVSIASNLNSSKSNSAPIS